MATELEIAAQNFATFNSQQQSLAPRIQRGGEVFGRTALSALTLGHMDTGVDPISLQENRGAAIAGSIAGGLPPALLAAKVGGPVAGFAALGAMRPAESTEERIKNTVGEGMFGALFKVVEPLSRPARAAILGNAASVATLLEGGTLEEAAVSGGVMAGFGALGRRRVPSRVKDTVNPKLINNLRAFEQGQKVGEQRVASRRAAKEIVKTPEAGLEQPTGQLPLDFVKPIDIAKFGKKVQVRPSERIFPKIEKAKIEKPLREVKLEEIKPEAERPSLKKPHEMTGEEFAIFAKENPKKVPFVTAKESLIGEASRGRRAAIEKAVIEGKIVPDKILSEFPGVKQKAEPFLKRTREGRGYFLEDIAKATTKGLDFIAKNGRELHRQLPRQIKETLIQAKINVRNFGQSMRDFMEGVKKLPQAVANALRQAKEWLGRNLVLKHRPGEVIKPQVAAKIIKERVTKPSGKKQKEQLAKEKAKAEEPIKGGVGRDDPVKIVTQNAMFQGADAPFAGKGVRKNYKNWLKKIKVNGKPINKTRLRDLTPEEMKVVHKRAMELRTEEDRKILRRVGPEKKLIKDFSGVEEQPTGTAPGIFSVIRPARQVMSNMGEKAFRMWNDFQEANRQMRAFVRAEMAPFKAVVNPVVKELGKKNAVKEFIKITHWLEGKDIKLTENGLRLGNYIKQRFDAKDPNSLYAFFGIKDVAGEVPNYAPRVAKNLRSLLQDFGERINAPESWTGFQFKKRTGNLIEREENIVKLFEIYLNSGVKTKFLSPVLEKWAPILNKKGLTGMELAKQKYMKQWVDRQLGIPAELDLKLENTIQGIGTFLRESGLPVKQIPEDAGAQLARFLVDASYSGALGFRPMAPLRNLTQSNLTFAEIGGKWVVEGFKELRKSGFERAKKAGVIEEFVPDVEMQFTALGSKWQTIKDASLWMFKNSDYINRSVAFYGGRAKILNAWKGKVDGAFIKRSGLNNINKNVRRDIIESLQKGKVEEAANKFGFDVQARTQYIYSKVGAPLITRSIAGKLAFQFQTWPVNYVELLGSWMRNGNYPAAARWALATFGMIGLGGKAGVDMANWVGLSPLPTGRDEFGNFTFPVPPTLSWSMNMVLSPVAMGQGFLRDVAGAEGELNKEWMGAWRRTKNQTAIFIPGGLQMKEFNRVLRNQKMSDFEKAVRLFGAPIEIPK